MTNRNRQIAATFLIGAFLGQAFLAAQDYAPASGWPTDGATVYEPTVWEPPNVPPLPPPLITEPSPESMVEQVPRPTAFNYSWYDPRAVFSPVFWDGNIQFGLNGSEGNAETLSLRSGLELSRETARTNWDIDLTYANSEQSGIQTQHNALLWNNFDYKLSNPNWSWFVKSGLEYDEFKNFNLRLSKSTGLGYLLVDTPFTQFRTRFGSGVSHEIGGANDDFVAEAVFGFDLAHKINESNKISVVHDYYPDWSKFSNFRQVTDAGWEILLSEATGLSLKVGVIHRFDSTPEGAEKSDVDFSVLLLWAL